MLKIIPVFLLLFTGYLCNAQSDKTWSFLPTTRYLMYRNTSIIPLTAATGRDKGDYVLHKSDHAPEERSLPTVVLAGVSIALVLLCVLIVGIFWYAWKKSQVGPAHIFVGVASGLQVFFVEGPASAMIIEVFKKVQWYSILSPVVRLECPYKTLRCLGAFRSGLLREQCHDSRRAAASPSGRKENHCR